MTSGGGCSGGGFGGSGGFRKTIVVSTGRFLMVSATPWVAFTAPKIMSPCSRRDRTVCPRVFGLLCFDSIRFSNTYYLQGEG
jgi:hypothetical protein